MIFEKMQKMLTFFHDRGIIVLAKASWLLERWCYEVSIGSRIRWCREQRNESQASLAAALGYNDRSSIAKIESGKSDLTQSKIEAFARALHTTPEYLLGWTDDPYDYDLDEDSRFSEIPTALFEELCKQYDEDLEDVWRAWQSIQSEDRGGPAPRPLSKHDLLFALWGGAEDMDEEDLKAVLDYAEYLRQKKQKDK